MKRWIMGILGMVLCAGVGAEDRAAAQLLLEQAKEALAAKRYREAKQCLARVQVFHYQDAERMPEALYYEALIDMKTGGSQATVSALDELYALYPSSLWSDRAKMEFGAKISPE